MSVEWVRSCYSSAWLLFRDSPTTVTKGRFYFSPPGTPFYHGIHNLWSRTWSPNAVASDDSDFPAGTPALGEVLNYPHAWQSGSEPPTIALNLSLGRTDCIEKGDLLADGVPIADQVLGMPLACYLPPNPPNPDFDFAWNVWSCPTQAYWAYASYLLAYARLTDLTSWLDDRFEGASVTVVSRSTRFPAYATVVHPQYAIILLAGTSNIEQAFIEIIQSFQGPQDFGIFSTAGLWYEFSTLALKSLSALGVNALIPILSVGHSYGGASAQIAAGRLLAANPSRDVRYLTFGSPKAGDKRLSKILSKPAVGGSLLNEGDVIGLCPPTPQVAQTMATLLPPPLSTYANWGLWSYCPETTLLGKGTITRNTEPTLDSAQLAAFLLTIIGTGTVPTFAPHDTLTYLANIVARCNLDVPIDVGQVEGMAVDSGPNVGQVEGLVYQLNPARVYVCSHGTSSGTRVSSVSWSYGPYTNPGFQIVLARYAAKNIQFRPRLDGALGQFGTSLGSIGGYFYIIVGWVIPVSSGIAGTHTLTSQFNLSAIDWVQWYAPNFGTTPTPTTAAFSGTSSVPTITHVTPYDPIGARIALVSIANDAGSSLWSGMVASCLQDSESIDGTQVIGDYSGLVQGGTAAGTFTSTVGGTAPSWVGISVFIP